MDRKRTSFLFFTIFIISVPLAWASDVTIPNTFSGGSPAYASEVNDNFSAVEAAVDDNDARIDSNITNIAANTALINSKAGAAGNQNFSFGDFSITTTTVVSVISVTVPEGAVKDVVLNGHVLLEGIIDVGGRYQITIRRGGTGGTIVGYAWWRPAIYAPTYQASTVPVTGFDNNISGTQTYHLCVRKWNATDPDVLATPAGITATWVRN